MSEIKFACPHCQQHIACDNDYADMCIVCPSCGRPMVVPVLSATDPAHPAMCVVASVPTPRRRPAPARPTLDLWTKEEWAGHPDLKAESTPVWIISALITFILAAVLKALSVSAGWIITFTIVGGLVSGCFMAKRTAFMPDTPDYTDAGSIFTSTLGDLFRVGIWILALPALGLGLLFIGCAACQ
jgi:hypothetical protein